MRAANPGYQGDNGGACRRKGEGGDGVGIFGGVGIGRVGSGRVKGK